MRTRLLVVVLLALGALIAWLAFAPESKRAAAQPTSAFATSTSQRSSDVASASRATDADPSRTETAAVTTNESSTANARRAEEFLRGRVVDDAGVAVSGASVEITAALGDGFSMLDLDRRPASVAVASTTTDERGEFSAAVAPNRQFQVDVVAAGFARARVPGCKAGEHLEVTVRRAAALFGRVTRKVDGSPVAGARVACWPKDGGTHGRQRGARSSTDTDEDGRYRLDGVAPGNVFVSVAHEVEASPEWLTVELAAGETRERDFLLEPGATIRGRVVDASTGQPIDRAQIGQGWTFEKCVLTNAAGEYVFRGFSPGYVELTARARGYGKSERVIVDPTSGTIATTVDFELAPERTAHGRVVDARGSVIEGAYVAAVASEFGEGVMQRTDWCSATSDERGVFHLVGLRRDVRHSLFARREGYATVVYEFPALKDGDSYVELGDVVLPAPSSLEGTVVDAKQQPIAWQTVELRGANSDRARLLAGGSAETWGVDLYVAQRTARCDEVGRFVFGDLAPGRYTLSTRLSENHDADVTRDVAIEGGVDVKGVVLVLDPGLLIEGRITVPDHGAMPTVYISVDPEREGRSADCEAASDGHFVANGLSEGTYTLTAYPYASSEDREAGRVFLATKLFGIASGSRGVVLELREAAHLRGRVVDAANAAIEGAQVVALDAMQVEVDRTTSRADGSFELLVPAREPTELQANLPDDPEGAPARAVLRGVDPTRGEVELRMVRRG